MKRSSALLAAGVGLALITYALTVPGTQPIAATLGGWFLGGGATYLWMVRR